MELTIKYDGLKITCKCEKYGNFFEVEEITCPDYDFEIADFICDRYEKDQAFAMVIQDKLHTAYLEEQITRAGDVWEAQQEMMAMGGVR